jgi:phenylacetate-coenzyme A ligase PaaK-like adenylate-forming protein
MTPLRNDFARLLGPAGAREYELLRETQWWDPADRAALVRSRLASCFGVAEDAALDELLSRPYLTKAELTASPPPAARADAVLAQTSGSTGTPVSFLLTRHVIEIEYAYLWRHWEWAGFHLGDRAAILRGMKLHARRDGFIPHRVERSHGRRNLYISSYHLDRPGVHQALALMRRFRPSTLRVFPSTLMLLTRAARASRVRIDSVRSIITSSETLLPAVRQEAEQWWQTRVFDWYGQRERVAAIGQCENGSYHVNDEYSFVEFLPAANGLREVVGTSFHNDLMPLIRYRTGDLVQEIGRSCPCGRTLPAVDVIHGRSSEMLLTTDGRWLPPSALQEVLCGWELVQHAQVIQHDATHVEVRLVASAAAGEQLENTVAAAVCSILGTSMNVSVAFVDHLPQGATGKTALIANHLPQPHF